MSDQASTQNKQAAELPSPEDAYAHLFDQVHAQVFFTKVAQAGYAPRTEKEAADLLELAGKLRLVQEDPAVKQASDASSPYAVASSALDRLLGQNGMDGSTKQAAAQEQEVALNQAVGMLAQDPNIYNSVLSLKAAEAQSIAQQLGAGQEAA